MYFNQIFTTKRMKNCDTKILPHVKTVLCVKLNLQFSVRYERAPQFCLFDHVKHFL